MALIPPSLGGSGSTYSTPKAGSSMDPLTIAAIASSLFGGLFGGGGEPQEKKSYSGMASPQRTLEDALRMTLGAGRGLESRGPVQLRSVVPKGPEPIRIPGLNFQIGGGLGMDPALTDPSVLTGRGPGIEGVFGPMAGAYGAPGGQAQPGQRGSKAPGTPSKAQPRKPSGGGF